MASSTNGITSYAKNRHNYNHHWKHGTLFTTLDSTSCRVILTTVFVVLNLSIVVAATFLLKKRNLYILRKKQKPVPMNHLTSWMSLTSTISYAWDTCQLPGGIYGLLMFATGGFGLAHQYFVNVFILPVPLQSNCNFEYGVVTTYNYSTDPVSTFSSASTVYDGQYRVWLNGGAWGIYDKVNYTSTTFSPTPQDVIGWWDCFYYQDTTIAWNEWQNQSLVKSFLNNQRFLFPGLYYIGDADNPVDKSIQGFLAWNAEQLDNSTIPWSVRASIADNLDGSAAPPDSTAAVTNLECLLVAKSGSSLPGVNMSNAVSLWKDKMFGFLMGDLSSFYKVGIEWMLNAMVMVSGSGNNDRIRTLPAGTRPTFGCSVHGTKITSEIWVILSVIFLVLVLVVLADIYLLLSLRFDRERNANLVESSPSSVQKWQLALLRDVMSNDTITVKQMRDYAYGWDMGRYGWIKIQAHPNSWRVAILHAANRALGPHCQIEDEMPSTRTGRAKRKAREMIEAAIKRMEFAAPDRRSPDTQELGGSTHQESEEQINGTPTKQNNSEDVVPLQETTVAERIPEP